MSSTVKQKKRHRKKKQAQRKFIAIVAVVIIIAVLIFAFREQNIIEKIEEQSYPLEYQEYVMAAAEKYDLDPALIFAIIHTESRFDPEAVSPANAMGLMQITKDTYFFVNEKDGRGDLAVELLFDPEVNIDTGSYFIKWLIDDFGDVDTAIAAYNAGRGNVKKWLGDSRYSENGATLSDIPFTETKNYVKKVNSAYEFYKKHYFSDQE
ncbi:MAG: lytic transglycosylase domain-containing protein [Clostridia bacterium]|nr:lytic transglycosylase domain-containing protein [Clostridia bacterium]